MSTPFILTTWSFGPVGNDAAFPALAGGASALDTVVAAATAIEDDTSIDSVGVGGLPDAVGFAERLLERLGDPIADDDVTPAVDLVVRGLDRVPEHDRRIVRRHRVDPAAAVAEHAVGGHGVERAVLVGEAPDEPTAVDPAERVVEVRREFAIPDTHEPIGAITIGHLAEDAGLPGSARTRRRIALDDVVHRGGWGR